MAAQDTIVLKNGESAEVVLEAVTDNIVTFTRSPAGKQTIPMERVDHIVWGFAPGEKEALADPAGAPVGFFEKCWNDQFGQIGRPRSRTARHGLHFADQLLAGERELDWKRALGIFNRVREQAWSDRDRADARQGRIRALIRLGDLGTARSEAETFARETEEPALLIDVRHLLATAQFEELKALEEEHPKWEEDDEVRPRRNELYHEAVDQFLWPHLFHGTREARAARGLFAAAEVHAFAGESGHQQAALEDLLQLYPGTGQAEHAKQILTTLSHPPPSDPDHDAPTD